jgi:membrane associated rhomboid family serine protease
MLDCFEVRLEQSYRVDETVLRRQQIRTSYRMALSRHRMLHGLARISWMTWSIAIITVAIWCVTAYQTALAVGAHSTHAVIANILSNALTIQDKENDALSSVLITYGAKDNDLILHGQYWRLVTPIFLHTNLLHIGLNMLNFAILGVFLERLAGHARFLLIYLVTGVISIIASCLFSPQNISVGASGAIFGLVGAYSIFVLMHRRAFPQGGIPALLWLALIIGLNLAVGLFIPNVDNYAHLGGLLSGFLLGWWFTPCYKPSAQQQFTDVHSLARRWPLALLTLIGTLALAIFAVHSMGG